MLQNAPLSSNDKDWVYNGLDCCVTLEIRDELLPQLDEVSRKTYEFSKALQAPILEMTLRGTLVSQRRRSQVLDLYRSQIKTVAANVTRLAVEGIGFERAGQLGARKKDKRGNVSFAEWWRSPLVLKNLFYDVLGIPPVRKRDPKTGKFIPTVNREALEKASGYFIAEPIAKHILTLRDLDKKRGFLETGIDPDGRMRCNFNIAGTNTGRLASSMSDFGTGTNLQNVDRELRSVFIADKGFKFANLDLEQGDARNVGAICWDLFVESHGEAYAGAYLDACESGDLHTAVCKMAWKDLPWTGDLKKDKAIAEQIAYRQDSYRQLAKKLGHGTNYYGTPRTMAKHTKVEQAAIEAFQVAYFRAFPAIGSFDHDPAAANYHTWVRKQLATLGYITTPFGRRRFFFGRPTDDSTLREAIAYAPQSMTADEIDTGILSLWRAHRIQLLIQVHDSILLQYPEDEEETILPWAIKTLQTKLVLKRGREFTVPVDAKVGYNWGDFDATTNPDGLAKWRGVDTRKRLDLPNARLSIRDYL